MATFKLKPSAFLSPECQPDELELTDSQDFVKIPACGKENCPAGHQTRDRYYFMTPHIPRALRDLKFSWEDGAHKSTDYPGLYYAILNV